MSGVSEKQAEKFWSAVDRRGPDECWMWKRSLTSAGYGQVVINTRHYLSHRIAYELAVGPITEACVCHTCDNKPCCNPAHLFQGSHFTNAMDKVSKDRESRTMAKLTPAQVRALRRDRAEGMTYMALAEKYGVSYSPARYAALGLSWRKVK